MTSGVLKTAALRLQEKFVSIPTNIITDQYAFSFADSGWNFFRELVASYEQNPEIPMKGSTFFKFFQHERVQSVRYLNDLLFLHDQEKLAASSTRNGGYNFYFGTFPWGEWSACDDISGGEPWGYYYDYIEKQMTRDMDGYRRNPFYQPGDEYPLAIEWEKTIKLYHEISKHGYWPLLYGTYPEVVLMIRKNGQRRAIVHNGQHRMSILHHLGYKKLLVFISRDSMKIIHEDNVDHWYYVRNGRCTKEVALLIFNAFFDLNGRERIEYLGLPTTY